MKSLYESILSKTGTGKIYRIREWVGDHISLSSFNWKPVDNIDPYVSFNGDDSINVKDPKVWFFLDNDEQVPNMIKFGDANVFGLAWNGTIKDWSFLPNKMQGLFFTNHRTFGVTTVTGLKLDLGKIQLDDSKPFEINTTKIDIQDIEIKCGKNKKVKLNVPGRKFVNVKCDATDILLEGISSQEVARWIKTDPITGYITNIEHFFPKKNYPKLTYVALGSEDRDLVLHDGAKKWQWI